MSRWFNKLFVFLSIIFCMCSFQVKATENLQLQYVSPENLSFNVTEQIKIKVRSNYSGEVEYKAYIYLPDEGIWESATEYSQNVCPGNVEKTITLNKKYPQGNYRISVWVRRKGTAGNIKTNLGSYDAYSTTNVNVEGNKITYVSPVKETIVDGESISLKVKSNYSGDVEYKAYIYLPDEGIWESATEYSENICPGNIEKTITLNKKYPQGNYRISVWVRKKGTAGNIKTNLGSYDAYSTTNVNVEGNKITYVSPVKETIVDGESISLKVKSNYSGDVEYKAYIYLPHKDIWESAAEYSENICPANIEKTITLNKKYPQGNYRISVWVRKKGTAGNIKTNLGSYDAYSTTNVNVEGNKITYVSPVKETIVDGENISLKVKSNYSGDVEYKAYIYLPYKDIWESATEYSENVSPGNIEKTITLNKKYTQGNYRISVWVRKKGTAGNIKTNLGSYDAYSTTMVNVEGLKIKSIMKKNDFIEIGQHQEIRVISNSCNKIQYKILLQEPGSREWKIIQEYGQVVNGNEPYVINPDINYLKGTYRISVWIKNYGEEGKITNLQGLGKYDNYAAINFNVYEPLKISSLNIQKTSLNTSDLQGYYVCANDDSLVQYKILINYIGTDEWKVIQQYGQPIRGDVPYYIMPSFKYKPGEYRVSVWVKRYGTEGKVTNIQGQGKYDDYKTINFKCVEGKNKFKICIDPGHGGYDSGAVGPTGVKEKDVNLKVALKLGEILKNNGIDVIYTRTNDNVFWPSNESQDLEARVKLANDANVDLYISIHANSYNGSANGTETYYYYNSNKGKEAALAIQNELVKTIGLYNRGIKTAEYYVLKNASAPSILTELGFIDNRNEELLLNSDWFQQKCAEAIGKGVLSCSFIQQGNDSNDESKRYIKTYYDLTLEQMVEKQMADTPAYEMYIPEKGMHQWRYAIIKNGQKGYATNITGTDWIKSEEQYEFIKNKVKEFINPINQVYDPYAQYQFLKLSYNNCTTAQDLNLVLTGKGVLEGKGQIFIDAGRTSNVNPIYLIAHSLLETGNGKSTLAQGVIVNGKKVYNLFGIHAYDNNPIGEGSQYAYEQCWFSVDDAIRGGAKWISQGYINNTNYKQDTLYKMRWNPDNPTVHQYATDIKWAYNQINNIKKVIDLLKNYVFNFEIPVFKS